MKRKFRGMVLLLEIDTGEPVRHNLSSQPGWTTRYYAEDWERPYKAAEQRAAQLFPEADMNQIGTTGTKLLRASRARRKGRIRKLMRLAPEVAGASPDGKLSLN